MAVRCYLKHDVKEMNIYKPNWKSIKYICDLLWENGH